MDCRCRWHLMYVQCLRHNMIVVDWTECDGRSLQLAAGVSSYIADDEMVSLTQCFVASILAGSHTNTYI